MIELLKPMLSVLDEKNITEGIYISVKDNLIYCCFEKSFLSNTNNQILIAISKVYSDIFFYTDNLKEPYEDKLIWWCPNDRNLDDPGNTGSRCLNKKGIAVVLNQENLYSSLAISLLISSVLQQQNPLSLSKYKDSYLLSTELIQRSEEYYKNLCPDNCWFTLTVSLNHGHPLRDNPYAPFYLCTSINAEEAGDNIVQEIVHGTGKKIFLNFCCGEDEKKKAITDYINYYTGKEQIATLIGRDKVEELAYFQKQLTIK